ncbi:hypothetical protein ABZ721_07665 [Streptomyces sp. NPDC006733]|uniref:hypothetical protein n=1 Tax=Streptomyces sp. NPDC006733 TaxID=3155460 RepID=UPI00340A8AB1
MSTHTPPTYPNVLNWFKGGPPDTADIASDLTDMTKGADYQRLVSHLRLHGELGAFESALRVAFPQFTAGAPAFPMPKANLMALDRATLKAAGVSCLSAISLGTPEPFNAKYFTWNGGSLCYQDVPVFCTVGGVRKRVLVGSGDKLYVAAADSPLKGWLRRGTNDVTVAQIGGVQPDGQESGYNAVNADSSVNWLCSFGDLTTPKGLIDAISKSEVFGSIVWIAPYVTAGWVASLMPTLSFRGTIAVPGGTLTVGQNVHSPTVVGSAWVEGFAGLDCKQADFPVYWKDSVVALLCPKTTTHADFQHTVVFCDYLKAQKCSPVGNQGTKAELERRLRLIIGADPSYKAVLIALPNIQKYYPSVF